MLGFKIAQRTITLAVAATALAGGATFATAGAASAAPVPGASAASASAAYGAHDPGAVLIKRITSATGILSIYKLSGPPQAATNKVRLGNAGVRPLDGGGCNGIDPQVCFTVVGQGYYVEDMENNTWFGESTVANFLIKSPSGAIVKSATGNVTAGWIQLTWAPFDYEAGGWWCGYTNADGGPYTGECVDIHN